MEPKLEKKFVDLSNGERYAYVEKGKGEKTLLLIHGNMGSSLYYLPLFRRLPDDIRVIAVDLRGFGDSSYKKRFDHLDELANDVALFIKKLKLKTPLAVVGWSAGGGVALSLASKHADLVDKVVLLNSMSYRGLPICEKDEKGQPILTKPYKTKEAMAEDPIQVKPVLDAYASNNIDFMKYIWNLTIYTVSKPTDEDYDLYMKETFKQRCLIDLDWSLTQFNLGVGLNYSQVEGDKSIAKMKAKLLSIYGEIDVIVPDFMVRETVGALGDKARLVIYKNCGHSPLVDKPDQLTKDILAFLAE
ncbi:MAG: Tropinesterase [Tenericutes bacterium ADurb.Bin087]|nr:MAG: Tropinesterase [Tenericutes bacterium ADurb.Bin087]